MNIDLRRKQECLGAKCGLDKSRCLIKYGTQCIKNGGTKIPVQSSSVSESFYLTVEAQTTFKPYFITDGWSMEEDL